MRFKKQINLASLTPILICLIFFVLYCTLATIKHAHFISGYDLAVVDQAIWKYSQFKTPIATIHSYFDTPIYFDHLEPIFIILSPLYWINPNTYTLITLQVLAVIASGYAVYLLAKDKKIPDHLSIALLINYLAFYGIQNAIWADVHSLVFAIPFLSFYIYFLETENYKWAIVPFLFAIFCKEDIALFTLLIALIQYIITKNKKMFYFIAGSLLYLSFVFIIFFPHFTNGYRFQNANGIFSGIKLSNFYNSSDKQQAIFFSLANYGFIPIGAPVYLLLFLADLAHYFVLGNRYVSDAQGLFLHYRGTIALFLSWPTIIVLSKYKKYSKYLAFYLILCTIIIQYFLHLPLSYLTKSWFWKTPESVNSTNIAIKKIPAGAKLATQVNIAAHTSHRDFTYTLWPTTKEFKRKSPCGNTVCDWFRIGKQVDYILVDTSTDWDARYFLEDRQKFINAIQNLEKTKTIKPIFRQNTTYLFKVTGKI
ncbi:MAG TPA: DUF2079 domain-containing protein [Patescibacteria group bacterium]|nr:DUF2079 domain-containing protein [Patescibacteria group bacterium]